MSDGAKQLLEPAQVPPYDFVAEAAVLTATIADQTALPKVIDFLRPEHFSEANRWVFEACVTLFRAGEPVDLVTVGSWLHARDRLKQIGGVSYLCEVVEGRAIVPNVRSYAVSVHDMWRRRQLIAAAQKIVAQGYTAVSDVQEWCDESTKALAMVGLQNPVRPVESNDQALARILKETDDETSPDVGGYSPVLTGFPIGIHGIDRLLCGLGKGRKTTVAATTGVGKTTFAGQASVAVAKQDVGVLFFSMEMKRVELLRRWLSSEAEVSGERIKRKTLSATERARIAEAVERLKKLPILIVETPKLTIEEVCAITKAEREKMLLLYRVPLGMVVLDYIQRIEPSRHLLHREPNEQIAHATKGLKMLAQELDIVALELAQAKDSPPGRKPERPKVTTGIADSSKIAKESDDVIFLYPEDDPVGDPRQSVTAIVGKQRSGAKGDVPLMFRRDLYKFIDSNTPDRMASPSRQYVDARPEPEPEPEMLDPHPELAFAEPFNALTDGL